MSHLLLDTSTDVQKMAYHLLNVAAKKRTEHLVIEAGVDVESTTKINLPDELIAILQLDLSTSDEEGLLQEQVLYPDIRQPAYLFDSADRVSLAVSLVGCWSLTLFKTRYCPVTTMIGELLTVTPVSQSPDGVH